VTQRRLQTDATLRAPCFHGWIETRRLWKERERTRMQLVREGGEDGEVGEADGEEV